MVVCWRINNGISYETDNNVVMATGVNAQHGGKSIGSVTM